MADDFKTLIGIAYDTKQAQSELNRQIKSLQKNAKLALDIELSDSQSEKVLKSQSKMWSNYRKEAVAAITAPNSELQKMSQYYRNMDKEARSGLALKKKLYLDELTAYKTNESMKQKESIRTAKIQQDSLNIKSNKTILDNNISTYLKENTKLSTGLKNRLIEIQSQIKDVDATGLKNLKQGFREVTSEAKSLGQVGDSAFVKLGKNIANFTQFLSAATVVMSGIRAIKGMVTEVKELDKAYVDLQQATGYTRKETGKLINTYFELGEELGATATDIAKSAADWLRQGKSIADTNRLIRDSMILSKIGQIDSANSTTYLTTAMKGYGVAVDDVLGIVDKLSAVDMASATSVAGLAEGMSEVATNANLAGISMDKLLGYLAVIGETTGEGMSSVGNSLSTMFSRMGNIKLARLKDYQNNGEDLSNVETVLRGLNIELRDSNKEFRNFGSVLDETAGRWSSFDGVTQRAIASSIAGKDHMEDFLVLMTNYGKATEYAEVSIDSAGTAMEKFGAYSDSVEAKTERLSNSFQKLSSNTINSSWIKGFLDLSNVLVNVIDKIGLFNIALLVTSGILGANTGLGLTSFANSLYLLATNMGIATGAATTLSMALSTILPLAGIMLAIAGATAAYKYFNVTLEENQEALSQLKGEYDSITSEVKSLEEQIASVQSKMKEMEKLNPIEFVTDKEYQKLSDSNEQLNRRLTIQRELQKVAAKDAEEQAIKTIGQKSENSIVNVKTIHSDYSGSSVKAEKVTRDVAITERIDEYKKLTSQIEELESKQYDLAKANNTESKEYKNVSKELNDVNNKRDEHYQYILKTMDALETESASIVGATKDSEKYTSIITTLGSAFDNFITEITKTDDAFNYVTDSTNNTTEAVEQTIESLYSLAEAAKEATGYVNDLGEDVSISKLQESIEGALNSVKDFNSILKSMDENKGLTSDDLDTITQKYPQLLSYIGNETELRKKLTQGIEDQKEVAKGYYEDVLELDTNLYNTIMSNNATKVNELSGYYNTDLSNYKSLARAKNEVETTLLTSLSGKWAKFYNAQSTASEIASHAQSSPLSSGIFGAAGGKDLNNAAIRIAQEQTKALREKAITEQVMYNQMKNLFVDTDYTSLSVDNILLSSDKSSKDTKDKFSQIFDWLSIRIDKLKEKAQSAIDSIAKYTSFKTKNSKIDIAVQAKVDEKSSLKAIQDSYSKMASKVGLSKEYRDLVDNGGMNVQTIKDEKLANKIEEYTKWKDAAKEVGESIEGISDEIKELNQQKLDNIKSYFDMKNGYTDSKISKRESLISSREAQGGTATKGDYNYLIKLQNDIITNNKKERDAYESLFNDQVKKGIVKKGSVEYYEGLSYLNDLTISAREAKVAIQDLSNEKIKLTFVEFDKDMTQTNKELSELDLASSLVDKDSLEQIALFQTGYAVTAQKAKDLNAEIAKLNKQYSKGSVSETVYKERLADLESQLNTNASAVQSYEQSIVSAMKARYDKELGLSDKALKAELKNIEKAKKAKLDALKAELDKFKEIIDARKKALQDEVDEDDYQKQVDKYTKDINKSESRIETLKQAELSGDREAQKERREAEEELSKLKEELTDLQKKYGVDKAIDALDEEYDAYEKMKNKQITDTEAFYDLQTEQSQAIYDNKVAQLETLYENERNLIIEAAQLTSDEFSKAFTTINNALSKYGLSASSGLSNSFNNLGEGYANNTASGSSVSKILGNPSENNKYNQDTDGMSGLNAYLSSQGYKMITTKQMVELAKALGLYDINSTKLVGTDEIGKANKKKIMNALIGAGFSSGGYVDASMVKASGEDGLALVKHGEPILTVEQGKLFKELVNNIQPLNNLVKLSTPNMSSLTNNNNSAPSIMINLPPSTTITKDAVSDYDKLIPKLTTAISNELLKKSKSR